MLAPVPVGAHCRTARLLRIPAGLPVTVLGMGWDQRSQLWLKACNGRDDLETWQGRAPRLPPVTAAAVYADEHCWRL